MEARHRWRTQDGPRSEIIELIEEIDQVNVNDTAIILDLVCWLDHDEAIAFLEHVRRVRELVVEEVEETQPPQGEPKFFSSLIPEC